MANEFKHASVGTELTQAEYESTTSHVLDSQAAGDIIYASSTTQLSRLGIGTAGKILQVNSGASAPEWTATVTGVTSVLNTSLVIGRDSDNDIDFATDNTILFRASGADQIKLVDGALAPVTNNDVDLGTSSLEFKDAFFDGTVTADAFAGPITGDVTGTATNATHVTVADNESTNENNLIPFIEDASATGNVGLESDGDFHYNPSSGTVTATTFVGNVTGNVTGTASTATVATTVTITDNESTNEDNAIIFTAGGDVDGGNIGLESDGTLTYNPSTGKITATGFIGALTGNVTGDVTGNADTATVATTVTITDNESTNEDNAIVFTAGGDVDGGNIGLESDGTLTYNPSTGKITATGFIGALTGNADTATALATGRTIAMTGDVAWTSASFDGSGNVTGAGTIQSTAVESGMLNNNVISGQTEISSGLAAEDELLYSDGGTLKKVGLDNFVELSPQLATEDTVAVASDYLLFLDGGATGNMNKESVADFVSAIAGTGLSASSGQLTASGGGIDNAVIFRLTSDFTGDADPIATNLEQDDTTADSTLGDSGQVSQTSGVFSFPTRGHYLVQAHVLFGNGAADAETNLHIQVTTGSGYSDATVAQGSVYNSSARTTIVAQTIVDVASTSTHKVRFKISGNSSSNTVFGSTSINYTYFTFIRLADTDST
jgi:uncharacterized protein (DUF736 family)|tara:strand:- start:69 stop:2069 length:2001 start_codon:yes stop_codon:yes gene_type:complete